MSVIVNKLDLKDIVMVVGIISSICGAAVAFAINSERIETTMQAVKLINNELTDDRKVDQDQNIILERITSNMNYLTDQIKDIKQIIFTEQKEETHYRKNKDDEDSKWRR